MSDRARPPRDAPGMPRVTAALLLCVACARAHDIDGQPDEEDAKAEMQYGVDVSYPIHHGLESGTFQWERWHRSMEHCAKRYSKGSCDANERSRMQLNRVQPPLQRNYTELGYAKLKAPEGSYRRLKTFFDQFRNNEQEEAWPAGNTYTNHWDVPTYMISLEDQRLRGGLALKTQIWNEVQAILEEWTGQKLKQTSLYGIRVYKEGSVLASHVDRLPLVTSAIINVDQDVDEPWPVEVYDHDGNAHNVTMEPGDIVLYESHTVMHGRPAPLKGVASLLPDPRPPNSSHAFGHPLSQAATSPTCSSISCRFTTKATATRASSRAARSTPRRCEASKISRTRAGSGSARRRPRSPSAATRHTRGRIWMWRNPRRSRDQRKTCRRINRPRRSHRARSPCRPRRGRPTVRAQTTMTRTTRTIRRLCMLPQE